MHSYDDDDDDDYDADNHGLNDNDEDDPSHSHSLAGNRSSQHMPEHGGSNQGGMLGP